MTPKIPKSGRYVVIGRLYIPIDDPMPSEDPYKIGPARRAARVAVCQSHDLPRSVSNFTRVWNILTKKGGE